MGDILKNVHCQLSVLQKARKDKGVSNMDKVKKRELNPLAIQNLKKDHKLKFQFWHNCPHCKGEIAIYGDEIFGRVKKWKGYPEDNIYPL